MALMNPAFTLPLLRRRPVVDNRGNITEWLELVFSGVVSLQQASKRPRMLGEGEDLYVQDAELFMPRGTDVIAGDHVVYSDWTYIVAGRPRGEQPHPFTGADFGWVSISMQAQG